MNVHAEPETSDVLYCTAEPVVGMPNIIPKPSNRGTKGSHALKVAKSGGRDTDRTRGSAQKYTFLAVAYCSQGWPL